MSSGPPNHAKWCRLYTVKVAPANRKKFLSAVPDKSTHIEWDESWATAGFTFGEESSCPNTFYFYEEHKGKTSDMRSFDADAKPPGTFKAPPPSLTAAFALAESCVEEASFRAQSSPFLTSPSPKPWPEGHTPFCNFMTVTVNADDRKEFLEVLRARILGRRRGTDFIVYGPDLRDENKFHVFEYFTNLEAMEAFDGDDAWTNGFWAQFMGTGPWPIPFDGTIPRMVGPAICPEMCPGGSTAPGRYTSFTIRNFDAGPLVHGDIGVELWPDYFEDFGKPPKAYWPFYRGEHNDHPMRQYFHDGGTAGTNGIRMKSTDTEIIPATSMLPPHGRQRNELWAEKRKKKAEEAAKEAAAAAAR
jgi:hypothetical protein